MRELSKIRSPRDIETNLRKNLGAIGPYMCVAEVAVSELADSRSKESVEELCAEYGHTALSLEQLQLNKMKRFVNLAHLAFISSKADRFCEEVKSFNKSLWHRTESYTLDSLDQLRRVIFLVHARKENLPKSRKTLKEEIYADYVGLPELTIIDYYRKIRNQELHGGSTSPADYTELSTAEIEQIKKKYNYEPKGAQELEVRDVILYSQAWQKAAINICRRLVQVDAELMEALLSKYSKKSKKRRDNAIHQKLVQDYLQPKKYVDKLMACGWIA